MESSASPPHEGMNHAATQTPERDRNKWRSARSPVVASFVVLLVG